MPSILPDWRFWPGIADLAACLRDGYSTGGTSGNGLGAIKRLAHQMLVHSEPQKGTAVLVRMGGGRGQAAARESAVLCVAKAGETVCGDTGAMLTKPDGTVAVLLADGLGHGPQ